MRKVEKDIRVCLNCGKEYLAFPSNKSKYCCRKCYFEASKGENWHSYNKESVPCSECGKGILMNQYKKTQNPRHFCNSACRKLWYEKNMSGELSPIYKKVDSTCNNCGNPIKVGLADVERSKHHFCNKKCFDEFAGKGMKKGANHGGWKGGDIEISCAFCGEKKMVTQSKYNNAIKVGGVLCCDAKCMGKWRSLMFKGETSPIFGIKRSEETKLKHSIARKGKFTGALNPAWKGGCTGDYPYAFKVIRPTIRKMYGDVCQICGEEGIFVHHIDYNKYNIEPSNLITLCAKCHAATNFTRYFWESHFKYRKQLTN